MHIYISIKPAGEPLFWGKPNQACRELYQLLLAKGKAKKLALIAVANKLLTQALAIAASLTPYKEPTAKPADIQVDLTKQNLAPA